MHSFKYTGSTLHCEKTDLEALAATHGTPLYVYSSATFRDHYKRFDKALKPLDHMICYAVKANSNLAILNLLAREGSGFDIVSGGELYRVIEAGGDPGRCTFAGVGKSAEEIVYALKQGIYSFNVESEAELRAIDRIAGGLKLKAPVAIRVNPDVEAGTHKYISTGKSENKFGIGIDRILDVYEAAAHLPNLILRGVQMHIGSQITNPKPFAEAVKKMTPVVTALKARHQIEFFSIGGGMGIVYDPSLESGGKTWWKFGTETSARTMKIEDYTAAVVPELIGLGLRILVEPGRFLSGNAGVLLTRVQYVKRAPDKTFTIVDAGMNDLIRPALYQSFHEIVPVKKGRKPVIEKMDIVGPVCESGDFFAQDRELPRLEEGDLVALMSAGAYGFVMASNYNSRPLPAEVLVNGAESAVIRRRQTKKDLIKGEQIPKWTSA